MPIDSLDSLTDKELIIRISQKDYKAFNELWRRYDKRVMSLFYKLLRDKFLVEDSRQEFFITIWNKSQNYRGGDAKAYFYGIIKNITRNKYKETTRRNIHELPQLLSEGEMMFKLHDTNEHDSPYNILLYKEVTSKIREFESKLSKAKKMIFALRTEELKWKDISQRLKIPENTCSSVYSRLCKKLKDFLKEYAVS